MEQYINKSALIAEIEKVTDEPAPSHDQQCDWEDGYCCGLSKAESIINTLEVKEVDLEAEINKWRHNHFNGRRDKDACGEYLERPSQLELAKYFFELGLKTAKGGNNGSI